MENQGLLAPESYWNLSEEQKYEMTNGCGPERATRFVPSALMGVNIQPACDIHDFTYTQTHTVTDREDADFLFLYNIRRLIDRKLRPGFFRSVAYLGADLYVMAVRLFGGRYFKKNQ